MHYIVIPGQISPGSINHIHIIYKCKGTYLFSFNHSLNEQITSNATKLGTLTGSWYTTTEIRWQCPLVVHNVYNVKNHWQKQFKNALCKIYAIQSGTSIKLCIATSSCTGIIGTCGSLWWVSRTHNPVADRAWCNCLLVIPNRT